MALTTGDSAVAAPIESNVSTVSTNMDAVAIDNQAGMAPASDTVKAANDQVVASLGLPTSDQLFKADDADDATYDPSDMPARAPHPSDNSTTREPDVAGKEKDLSKDNQERLKELQSVGAGEYNESGDLAETQRALQEQADRYGTNPDGSPKVSILAYQTRDVNPQTSFYASFAGDKMGHTINQEFLEYSRKHQTEYPSRNVGYIGTVESDRRDGTRV